MLENQAIEDFFSKDIELFEKSFDRHLTISGRGTASDFVLEW